MKTINKNILAIFFSLLIIMVISLLNMYNAPLLSSSYNNHLLKQLIWYILGIILCFIMTKLNLKKLLKYSFLFYLLSLILLILVLFIGSEVNGAQAWFNFKFFSFQPSELMKLALALFLTDYVSKKKPTNFKEEILLIITVFFITIIPSIFVFLEPDTGAIIFYFLIALAILFISGIRKRWFILLFCLFIFLFLGFIFFYLFYQDLLIKLIGTSFFYRIERIITFQTESSYQLENALTVIGSSSFLGTGLHKISLYIPEAPTDFIFAFSIGNFGILSGIIILIAYLILNLSLINIYFKSNQKIIKLFLISFISIFLFQELINISMNLGLVPIIGIPLPFLSYGGSTIIIYFLFLGLILNFLNKDSRHLL